MNTKLFSCPVPGDASGLTRLYLTVQAQYPSKHYAPYPYSGVHSSPHRAKPKSCGPCSTTTAHDSLTRDRRTIAFADASGLAPQKFVAKHHRSFMEKVEKAVHCDHRSIWRSRNGTLFFLNEPYHGVVDAQQQLHSAGLIAMVVPVDLSPYCGWWDATPGSMPGTRSYLIGEAGDASELGAIIQRLQFAAPLAPRWNDVQGIHHV